MESNLQIISGKYRGKKLARPQGARPTQNRARMALFNMLAPDMPNGGGMTVWDAFAGSGAFGLEFLSRGWADTAILTDVGPASIAAITRNANGIDGKIIIRQGDAIKSADQFARDADVIFVDPPFDAHDVGAAFVKKIAPIVDPGVTVVWEMENGADPKIPETFDVTRDRRYGRARFLIMKKK